jgi:putative flippase GtrA
MLSFVVSLRFTTKQHNNKYKQFVDFTVKSNFSCNAFLSLGKQAWKKLHLMGRY